MRSLFNASQFGFYAHHSTTLQYIRLVDHITLNFNTDMSTAESVQSESDARNRRVRYHDGAAKILLPTDLVICAAQHHEGDEGPPGSIPL
jgi:hypothetical protein